MAKPRPLKGKLAVFLQGPAAGMSQWGRPALDVSRRKAHGSDISARTAVDQSAHDHRDRSGDSDNRRAGKREIAERVQHLVADEFVGKT